MTELNAPVETKCEEITDEFDEVFNEQINVNDMNDELLSFMNSQTQQYVTDP